MRFAPLSRRFALCSRYPALGIAAGARGISDAGGPGDGDRPSKARCPDPYVVETGSAMSSSHRCHRAPGAHAIRGAALPSRLIAIVVIVLVLGAGAWWFFMRPGAPPIPGVTTAP